MAIAFLDIDSPHQQQPLDGDLSPSLFAAEAGFRWLWKGGPGGLQEAFRGEHAFKQNTFTFQTTGPFGYAIQGTGQGNVGVTTGYVTRDGAVPLTGGNELTVIAFIEFTDITSSAIQFAIVRKDNDASSNQDQFALHYNFTGTGTITLAPLVATSGTSGWVGGTATAIPGTIETGVLYVAAFRWSAVRATWNVALTKVGSGTFDPRTCSVTTPTGTISTTAGSEANFGTHFNGDAYTPDYSSTSRITGGAIAPFYVSDNDLQRIANNPNILFEDNLELDFFTLAGGGTGVAQVSETDTAQPIAAALAKTLGQPAETDTAQPVAPQVSWVLGQPAETDLAQPVAQAFARTVAQVVETDSAQPVAAVVARTLGQPAEADSAQPVAQAFSQQAGQVTETDTAQPFTFSSARIVGQVAEADTAQPVTVLLTRTVGQVTETDLAQPLSVIVGKLVAQVLETDIAQPVTVFVPSLVGQVTEADTAQPVSARVAKAIGQPVETDTAQPVSAVLRLTLGQPFEVDTAQLIVPIAPISRVVSQVAEIDTAQPFTLSGRALLLFPLAGITQNFPLTGITQTFPLSGSSI